MREQGIVSTQSLQASVPSLVVGANGQGSRETESPTIRGQGATFQASPGVAVYMAEVPLISALTLSMQGGPGSYLDLQNIQVLKGPQGTLFGRNTTGGAILLEPNRPTNSHEYYAQVQGGNYSDREVQVMANVPIIDDRLMVRLAAEVVDRDGFTRDITFNKDRDDKHYWTGRLGITWKPTDTIENYLMVNYTDSDTNGPGLVNRGFNLAGLAFLPAGPFGYCNTGPDCSNYQTITDAQNARGPRTVAYSADALQKTEIKGVTDIFSWNLSDSLTVRNIANYSQMDVFYTYDGDGSIAQQGDVNPGGSRIPRDSLKQVSEELQLQGTALGDNLTYVFGGFYYKNEPNGTQFASAVNYCPLHITQAFGPSACAPSSSFYGVTSESQAAYMQGTYNLGGLVQSLDGLRLTLGYRYTWDKVSGFSESYQPTVSQVDDPSFISCSWTDVPPSPLTDASDCRFTSSDKNSAPTWTAGLDYDLTSDVLLYGKVSRGYKAGGFNTFAVFDNTRTFGPEVVTSYEAGFKSDFEVVGSPARLNMNVFYLDYESIQRASGDFNPLVNGNGAVVLSNAEATIKGVELDAMIRPIDDLELGLNYSHNDAEYKKFSYSPNSPAGTFDCNGFVPQGGTADESCLPMQYMAPNIFSAYARYAFPVSPQAGDVSLFVSYSWTDEQHTEALLPEQYQPGERLEAFGLINASLDWRNIAGVPLDVSLWGSNLSDKLYRISNSDVYQNGSLLYQATLYGEPRMYGVRVRYHWGK